VMEIVDGKIKEIRDYHQAIPARAGERVGTSLRGAERLPRSGPVDILRSAGPAFVDNIPPSALVTRKGETE